MVSATDLKIYKTTDGNGGAITGTLVPVGTPNNVFNNVLKTYVDSGQDYYKCVYLKNTHATESMDNFKLWLSDKSFPHDTEIKWALEPNVGTSIGYRWTPYRTFDGSGGGVLTVADDPSLDLNNFTIACWFRTSYVTAPPEGEGFMVCKGGWLSNDPNKNLNYGLWHSDADHLRGGFEEADGTDHICTSDFTINDGQWRHGVVKYDGSNVKLYVDGVLIETNAGSGTPATSTNDLMIGDNSFNPPHLYYAGALDEVCIWNRAISDSEITALYEDNTQNPTGLVYSNNFGVDDNDIVAQTIASQFTEPVGVTWISLGSPPELPNIGQIKAGHYFPIWLWYHVNVGAVSRLDDSETFTAQFDIPLGGTGTGGTGGTGGGSGGNPPPVVADWKIAVSGDWGCESMTDKVIDLIQANDYDLVIGVGDNAYESSGCWISKFNSIKSIFNSVYGNHEMANSDDDLNQYKTFFGHSLTYFTFKWQNVFFIMMDDNDFEYSGAPSDSVGSTQYNFIKSELERIDNDSTVTWKIAVGHHPWFGKNAQHPANEGNQVQTYHSLFTQHGVSFYLHGHNHHWERTHQVAYNSSDPRTPTIVDSSPPYVKNNTGLISMDSGAGGHDSGSGLYSLPDNAGYWAYLNRTHNGVWEMVASNGGQTLTCSFVEIGGDKFDTFVITAA